MFENPRRGRQARNFTANVPKILDLKSSSEQIFSRKLSLGAPETLICENVNPSFDLLFLIFHDFFGFFAAKEKKNRRIFFVKDIGVCFLFCNQL